MMTTRRPEYIVSMDSSRIDREVFDWLTENIQGQYMVGWRSTKHIFGYSEGVSKNKDVKIVIYFKDQSDAMAFKLTWCEWQS